MTIISDDVITALHEDIEARIDTISALKGKRLYIYSQETLSAQQQRTVLPFVFYHYAGMMGNDKSHTVMFDMYLFARSETLTQIKGNKAMPTATGLLQQLRKSMKCDKSKTNYPWVLRNEIPDVSVDSHLTYRQRWATNYHISN